MFVWVGFFPVKFMLFTLVSVTYAIHFSALAVFMVLWSESQADDKELKEAEFSVIPENLLATSPNATFLSYYLSCMNKEYKKNTDHTPYVPIY